MDFIMNQPWKFSKYVRSKRENQGGIRKDDLGNEVKVTDDKEKAEVFARYFSAVFTRERNDPFRQIPAAKIGRDVTDSESESESDGIRYFFQNPKSVGYLKSDHVGFKIFDSVQLCNYYYTKKCAICKPQIYRNFLYICGLQIAHFFV